MKCETIRERLLEASPAALSGRGESAVARHVRSCEGCHDAASRILAGTERLEAELGRFQPRMGEEEAVRLAFEGRAAQAGEPIEARRTGSLAVGRRWRRWAPIPLAAAAAITALVLTSEPPGQRLEEADLPARAAPPAAVATASPGGLRVDIPEEGRVAVFETSDPSITVVWFY